MLSITIIKLPSANYKNGTNNKHIEIHNSLNKPSSLPRQLKKKKSRENYSHSVRVRHNGKRNLLQQVNENVGNSRNFAVLLPNFNRKYYRQL